MCLILLAWRHHPAYPLVVAGNRDEFFRRRTAEAGFWPQAPQVLAGRDLDGGGTWMGITRGGRFAALTNFRDPAHIRPDAPSRGRLVADFLTGDEAPEAYLDRIEAFGRECNGYNLLVGQLAGADAALWWSSNVTGGRHALSPGIWGLSNDQLDTPWPKVSSGKSALEQALAGLPDDRGLMRLLGDDRIHPDAALPSTGVPLEWERLLSAAFVRSPDYGTRGSTVLLCGADGRVVFDEQTWLPGAVRGPRRRIRFSQASA